MSKLEPSSRRRVRRDFRPGADSLETRAVMARAELAEIYGNLATNNIEDDPVPFGIQFTGQRTFGGLGHTVAIVGDINNDGFDDFAISEPIVDADEPPMIDDLAPAIPGRVYLVFGSRNASGQLDDFRDSLPQERAGGLNAPTDVPLVGSVPFTFADAPGQANYVTGVAPGYNFDGVVFEVQNALGIALADTGFGQSIAPAGDLDGDNIDDMIIGAPFMGDFGDEDLGGGGRAYVVFGSTAWNNVDSPFNINYPIADGSTLSPEQEAVRVTTILYANTDGTQEIQGGNLGWSVAGVGQATGNSRDDVLIGDPLVDIANVFNFETNVGGAFLIAGEEIPNASADGDPSDRRFFVEQVTLPTNDALFADGAFFIGEQTVEQSGNGELAGWSVGLGGEVDRDGSFNELLIGAPFFDNGTAPEAGRAALIYGLPDFTTLRQSINPNSNIQGIRLSRINPDPDVTPDLANVIPGAMFQGTIGFEHMGWSVTAAGRFNNDAPQDIAIGAPSDNIVASPDGRVVVIYGRTDAGASTGIQGVYDVQAGSVVVAVNADGTTIPPASTSFRGEPASRAGYDVGVRGPNDTSPNNRNALLIGAPRFPAGFEDDGRAYLITGQPDPFPATFDLAQVETADPAFGLVVLEREDSIPPTISFDQYVGTSVAGEVANLNNLEQALDENSGRTVDGDGLFEFIIGAPGFTLDIAGAPLNAGGAFLIQGSTGDDGGGGPIDPPVFPPQAPSGGGRVRRIEDLAIGAFGEAFAPRIRALSRLTYKPIPRRVVQEQYLPDPEFRLRLAHPNANRRVAHKTTVDDSVFTRGRRFRMPYLINHEVPTIPRRPDFFF